MRARDVVGKRIVAVRQKREQIGLFRPVVVSLNEIVLDDGTLIRFVTNEGDCDYTVTGVVDKEHKNETHILGKHEPGRVLGEYRHCRSLCGCRLADNGQDRGEWILNSTAWDLWDDELEKVVSCVRCLEAFKEERRRANAEDEQCMSPDEETGDTTE